MKRGKRMITTGLVVVSLAAALVAVASPARADHLLVDCDIHAPYVSCHSAILYPHPDSDAIFMAVKFIGSRGTVCRAYDADNGIQVGEANERRNARMAGLYNRYFMVCTNARKRGGGYMQTGPNT
jgi:hypothetical protein